MRAPRLGPTTILPTADHHTVNGNPCRAALGRIATTCARGDNVPDRGYAIAIEYDGETRLVPELGAERHLAVETWRTSSDAFAFQLFQLIDPLDGRRVSRAVIEASHEVCSRRFADRRIG